MKGELGIGRFIAYVTMFAAAATMLAACAAAPTPAAPAAAPKPKGLRVIEGRAFGENDHTEFAFKGGTIAVYPDFGTPYSLYIRYDDGSEATASGPRESGCTSLNTCGSTAYMSGRVRPDNFRIASQDGRPWLDTELWSVTTGESYTVGPEVLGMTRCKDVVKYEGCKDGKIYSSASLPALMSVLEGEKSARKTPPSGIDAKSDSAVTVVGDANSTRLPVCNWRHRIGLDKVVPPPKWAATIKLVPASEQTPQHIEVTNENSVTVDVFANDTPFDRITIKLPKGHTVTIRPRYGTANCPDLTECKEASITSGGTTLIQQSLDGPLNGSKFWKVYNPLGGAVTYTACAGGTLFTGKDRTEVEAALASVEKKAAPQQDMVLDPRTGIAAPPDVLALSTPACDWTKRAAAYQKMIEAAKKTARDNADSAAGSQ